MRTRSGRLAGGRLQGFDASILILCRGWDQNSDSSVILILVSQHNRKVYRVALLLLRCFRRKAVFLSSKVIYHLISSLSFLFDEWKLLKRVIECSAVFDLWVLFACVCDFGFCMIISVACTVFVTKQMVDFYLPICMPVIFSQEIISYTGDTSIFFQEDNIISHDQKGF